MAEPSIGLGKVYVGRPGEWVELGSLFGEISVEARDIYALGNEEPIRSLFTSTTTISFETQEVDPRVLALLLGDDMWARVWFERDGGDPIEIGHFESALDIDPLEIAEAIAEGLREVYG